MVGIVIVNYNTYSDLVQCIESIYQYIKCEYRIYVVDNGSDENIKNKVADYCKGRNKISLTSLDQNKGYSRGNNIGIKKAIQDNVNLIAIVNSDIKFENDAISIMCEDLDNEIAVVGPRVKNIFDNNGQQLITTYNFLSALLDRMPFFYLKKAFEIGLIDADRYQESGHKYYGMVSGCCFLIDLSVFMQIGLFDENVFLYSEERILSIKLKAIKKKVFYEPNALVLHSEGKTTEKLGNPFADYHRYISDYYTVKRYCGISKLKLLILRYIRLLNFKIKVIMDKNYKEYYTKLKKKMTEIDNDKYEIGR